MYHVLPPGFHKIRHYGFLANGRRAKLREIAEHLWALQNRGNALQSSTPNEKSSGVTCPVCKAGKMKFIATIHSLVTEPYLRQFISTFQFNLSMNLHKGDCSLI